jgi:hypothetical protein
MRTPVTIAFVLTSLPALMGAGVYRWVDANGVVNFTQQQPQGVSAEHIEATSGRRIEHKATPPADAPEAASASAATAPEQPARDRLTPAQREALAALEAAEKARQDEVANLRKANCERAQGVLDRLSAHGRIRVRDADGIDRAMSEDERQERISKAQLDVVDNCVGGTT